MSNFLIYKEINYIETTQSKRTKMSALQDVAQWFTKRNPGYVMTYCEDSLPNTVSLKVGCPNKDALDIMHLVSSIKNINAAEFQQQAQQLMA